MHAADEIVYRQKWSKITEIRGRDEKGKKLEPMEIFFSQYLKDLKLSLDTEG